MSDDLVAQLRHAWDERERQLDEDEQVALKAKADAGADWYCPSETFVSFEQADVRAEEILTTAAIAWHIADHDPARVLAEVERGRRDIAAKRRILDECVSQIADEETSGAILGRRVVRALAEAEGLA